MLLQGATLMNAFWTHTGLRISYDGMIFKVEDLNPEIVIRNRLFRSEVLSIGFRLILAALFARRD